MSEKEKAVLKAELSALLDEVLLAGYCDKGLTKRLEAIVDRAGGSLSAVFADGDFFLKSKSLAAAGIINRSSVYDAMELRAGRTPIPPAPGLGGN